MRRFNVAGKLWFYRAVRAGGSRLLTDSPRPCVPPPAQALETTGETWVQFKAQYYLYALVFVVFDIETVFLYPWAVAYGQLGLFALAEIALFAVILVGGLAYAWRKGALKWM
jgi:hypothetical protein